MFTIRDTRPMRVCQGATRREFLRIGSLGLGGLSLSQLLAADRYVDRIAAGYFFAFAVGDDTLAVDDLFAEFGTG